MQLSHLSFSFSLSLSLYSIGGWGAPHPSTLLSGGEWWNVFKTWNRDFISRPSLNFSGFDGIDWDLEGNNELTSQVGRLVLFFFLFSFFFFFFGTFLTHTRPSSFLFFPYTTTHTHSGTPSRKHVSMSWVKCPLLHTRMVFL